MRGVQELLEVMRRLRDPENGCPWDRRQTFHTIAPYTIEEAYEVADVIAREKWDDLPDELGDLLFQVVFHAQLASEEALFDFDDVAQAVVDKMIRRHPHVFADEVIADEASQSLAWEAHKAEERRKKGADTSLMDDIASGLPALRRAAKLQRRAAIVGFDWPTAQQVLPKVHEELNELEQAVAEDGDETRIGEELGDLLFSCVNLARHLGVDADAALRAATLKFETRFRHMEVASQERGQSLQEMSPPLLEALWQQAKVSPDS